MTWRIAARLVHMAWVAAFAGAVVWVAPQSAVLNSTYEWGFRGMTMVCGLLSILIAIRLRHSRRPTMDSALLGLALGVGWWCSPEIVYFAMPAVLIGLLALAFRWTRDSPQPILRYAAVAVLAAVVGALPWIWANVGSHLRSLNQSTFGLPKNAPGYVGHLRIFQQYSLGLLFSLRGFGNWVGGRTVAVAILTGILLALLAAVVLCFRTGGPAAVLAISVLAFPFLLATSPAVWFWNDGRYVGYVIPLAVLVLAAGYSDLGRRVSQAAESIGPAHSRRRDGFRPQSRAGCFRRRRGSDGGHQPGPVPPAPQPGIP